MTAASAGGRSRKAVNGAAAEHLMNGFRRRLMAVAARNTSCAADAEDTFARTIELALRSCAIEGDAAQVEAWATVVCRREVWKIARRHRRKPSDSLEALGGKDGDWEQHAPADRSDPTPEERLLDAEALGEVNAVIAHLPANQRRVIGAYAQGWTSREIAETLGFSHRGVRKMLWRGKRTLRARLGVRA